MKYLIKNRKEFIISCGVFATFVIVLLWSIISIINHQFSYDNVIAIVAMLFEYCGWYYNMPTSEENCRHTGEMRAEKRERQGIYGEYFYTDSEVIEEEEIDEEIDEEVNDESEDL